MHFKITFIIAELFNATSTVNSNFCTSTSLPTRRTSIRQAEKRARKNLPPVLSPIRSPSPPKVPRRGVHIQEKTPKFPLPEKSGCENITNLNVNIGQRGKKPKRMHLPPDLIRKFAQLSERNTNLRKETGGILAGVQRKGHYQVTHLIVPEQTGGPDRWDMQDVTEITTYFVRNPHLVMLGFIHTHPNMTSFLSSVDLHALYAYARDNPDLVSIVLAPERGTAPAFTLTEEGRERIGNCTEDGFHHHEGGDESFYEVADHVIDDPFLVTSIIDLRK